MLNVLDLFSGIGGFSLGLERTGHFKTIAFCEIDEFCRRVLRKNWPEVPIFEDVTTLLTGPEYSENERLLQGQRVDVISGGFPCQDVSLMNTMHSIAAGAEHGERSGLWREAIRLAGLFRPRYIILENVPDILIRGFGAVLAGLAESGYDCEWHSIPAFLLGGEHQRDRVWVIAYDQSLGVQRFWPEGFKVTHRTSGEALSVRSRDGQWKVEPDLLRVPDGLRERLDKGARIKALGNSVIPQIPELIGWKLKENEIGKTDNRQRHFDLG